MTYDLMLIYLVCGLTFLDDGSVWSVMNDNFVGSYNYWTVLPMNSNSADLPVKHMHLLKPCLHICQSLVIYIWRMTMVGEETTCYALEVCLAVVESVSISAVVIACLPAKLA